MTTNMFGLDDSLTTRDERVARDAWQKAQNSLSQRTLPTARLADDDGGFVSNHIKIDAVNRLDHAFLRLEVQAESPYRQELVI